MWNVYVPATVGMKVPSYAPGVPKRAARVSESGARPPVWRSTVSVFSRPSTPLSDRVSVTLRSRPFISPANAGSFSQPTSNSYGPTVRRSCAAAVPANAMKLVAMTAVAATSEMRRVM